MKKIVLVVLSVLLVFSIASCASGTNNADNSSAEQAQESEQPTPEVSEIPEATPEVTAEAENAASSNILVVYFSATGSTKAVAREIADKTGADTFEIVPAQPYTEGDLNYNDENSRVCREHEDESLQDVALETTEITGWEGYDTVFVGYPIWWGNSAWVVDSFVKANDFSGKTVIPFATSASSDIGNSGERLANIAGTGNWQTGKRFPSGADASEIDSWLEELGY